jgi:hypothetical protein
MNSNGYRRQTGKLNSGIDACVAIDIQSLFRAGDLRVSPCLWLRFL